MNVRLVWMSKRRVPKNGIWELSVWPISITSPVRMSFVARSTASGFMWLPEPRWSSGPHFEGHRCASAGGCHDWGADWDTGLTGTVIAARTNADATAMRGIRLVTGFILIPPRKSVHCPAFRPQASNADPFRDAKRLRPKGATTKVYG